MNTYILNTRIELFEQWLFNILLVLAIIFSDVYHRVMEADEVVLRMCKAEFLEKMVVGDEMAPYVYEMALKIGSGRKDQTQFFPLLMYVR